MTWKPTHRITFTHATNPSLSQVYEVVLEYGLPGEAYTQAEFRDSSPADWELSDKGEWMCQGKPTPGGMPGTVVVEHISKQAAIARAAQLGLDASEYVTNPKLFGDCSPEEHYEWMSTAPEAEIRSWRVCWDNDRKYAKDLQDEPHAF